MLPMWQGAERGGRKMLIELWGTRKEAIEARKKVKVLWLGNWPASAIADYLDLPINFIEELITVYQRT